MGAGCLGEEIRRVFPGAELTGVDCWLRYLVDPACRNTEGWPSLSLYDSLIGGAEGDLLRFLWRAPNGSYDVLVLGDVLEHLQPEIALEVLTRARNVARLGVVVNTPICEFPQGMMWDNANEIHQFWWPREKWESLGGEYVGGSDRVGCFLFRAAPQTKPRLSVVIPAFNRRAYVDLCIRSLLRTVAPPYRFEIIVVDDGSLDGTDEYVRREFGWQNVRCIRRTKNIGKPNCPGLARNVGLRAARGRWVAFVDSDVLHCHDIIAATLDQVQEAGLWRAWGTWIMERDHNNATTVGFEGGRDCELPGLMWWCAERELLIKIGGFDERFTDYGAEDFDIWARLLRCNLEKRYIKGQFAVGLYASRGLQSTGGVISREQNIAQHKLWREDQTIVRNKDIAWGEPW